jgi:hypothetical protein
MLNFRIIFLFAVVSMFSVMTCTAQIVTTRSDTIPTMRKKVESRENVRDQNQPGNMNRDQNNARYNAANKEIKQIRSAKPDMTRASGARPPQIERPSGSRIPRGVGRPGGAVRPGKR